MRNSGHGEEFAVSRLRWNCLRVYLLDKLERPRQRQPCALLLAVEGPALSFTRGYPEFIPVCE